MPSIGIFILNTSLLSLGIFSNDEAGPPDNIIACGLFFLHMNTNYYEV